MHDGLQAKLHNYHPSTDTIELIKATPLVLLVGPTGAGKDSLKDKLLETGDYHHVVSHTTRPPRINHGVTETDGIDYHFVDIERAEAMIDAQAFIEVKTFSNNIYGTSVAEIQAAHDQEKVAVTDIEVQGVAEFKTLDPDVMAIFLLPPDFETWQQRLERRYGDVVDVVDVNRRFRTALDEIEQLLTTDYYMAIINDNLEQTVDIVQTYSETHQMHTEADAAARASAQDLARDIKAYLAQHA